MAESHRDANPLPPQRGPADPGVRGAVVLETADGRRFTVTDRDVAGRAAVGGDILEAHTGVSRRHAQFFSQGERWVVVDLYSSNGTFVDGQKIAPNQPTPFETGQKIGFSPALALTATIVAPPTAEPEPDPNRRTLVILFADIKGSVDFFQERGTLIARNWIFKLFAMLTKIIEEHGGTHLKDIGDAMLAIFDDPRAAARAAVRMQAAIREHNQGADASDHYCLRIGMNKGSVLFENNDVFGNAVNIASRVQDLTPPGRIYITGNFRQKLGPDSDLHIRFIGREQLKGVKAPTDLFEILTD